MSVRCFRKPCKGELRHALWIMTRKTSRCGLFIHGDRNEFQAPRYTVEELAAWTGGNGFIETKEITTDEVIIELTDWPEAQQEAERIFKRHLVSA